MKRKIILILAALSIIITSCYTVVDKKGNYRNSHQFGFPANSVIDNRLIGKWGRTFEVIDAGYCTQLLKFDNNGNLHYQLYYNDFLSEDFAGEFRSLSDTLLIIFYHTRAMEKLLIDFRNDQLFLHNLKSPFPDGHYSMEISPSSDGFDYQGK